MRSIFLLGLMTLTACQQTSQSDSEILHPFIGCWEDSTGLEREGWTIDPSGWLVGYAASRDSEGNVTFFEYMRIERGGEGEVLVVTGQDNSETRFTRRLTDDSAEHRFENPAHDYPQIISYKRNGDALKAHIALMDGTKRVTFDKTVCKAY